MGFGYPPPKGKPVKGQPPKGKPSGKSPKGKPVKGGFKRIVSEDLNEK
ncbi:hypothetical protein [Desulfoscipio sp. XC116]